MKKVSQKQLTDHVNLVKWQQKKTIQKFNLLTIHSLLLNSNPKFIELKQIIQIFNSNINKGILDRKHLQYEFTYKLFQMLRQMILIPNYQLQQEFLNKVYEWTRQGGRGQIQLTETINSNNNKIRPTTASTRSRALSAYSRPKSGVPTMPSRKYVQQIQMKISHRPNKKIDYDKLQSGDIEFYNGIRTIHHNQPNPKKRLKQFQRKIFYDQDPDSDIQIIDTDKNKKQQTFYKQPLIQLQIPQPEPQLNLQNQQLKNLQNLQNPNLNIQGQQVIGLQQQDQINIDDIDNLDGQLQQQPEQIIDKLRPKRKGYVQHETQLSNNKINYQGGILKIFQERNKLTKIKMEQEIMKEKMNQWAKDKSRIKREQRRRAQSARIVTKQVGIKYNQPKKLEENVNVINLQKTPVFQTILTRPKTAFKSFNSANRQQLIKNCFITSKMSSHIERLKQQAPQSEQRFMRIGSVAQRPKKKTFQQILRQAQSKIKDEQMLQIQQVKQRFAKNKVSFTANRIAKSVTYHGLGDNQDQTYQDQFNGQMITGINMLNNPFFKAGKKKKKKKKKK